MLYQAIKCLKNYTRKCIFILRFDVLHRSSFSPDDSCFCGYIQSSDYCKLLQYQIYCHFSTFAILQKLVSAFSWTCFTWKHPGVRFSPPPPCLFCSSLRPWLGKGVEFLVAKSKRARQSQTSSLNGPVSEPADSGWLFTCGRVPTGGGALETAQNELMR